MVGQFAKAFANKPLDCFLAVHLRLEKRPDSYSLLLLTWLLRIGSPSFVAEVKW
jgi:hypothetical protein